jgi:hypothetical protein
MQKRYESGLIRPENENLSKLYSMDPKLNILCN